MTIGGRDIVFQIDTGFTVNTLPFSFAEEIRSINVILKTWNQGSQVPMGMCTRAVCKPADGQRYTIDFVVFKEASIIMGR